MGTHLHVHSRGSVYDGISDVTELVDQAVKNGDKSLAITDHGSMSELFKFQEYAKKQNIKPILGIEGYLVDELVTIEGKKRKRTHYNHVIMLASNEQGWKNICHLNYIANLDEEHYYYKPRNTFEELFKSKEGVVIGSACMASVFSQYVLAGEEEKAEEYFKRFVDEFGENFYAEIQLNELKEEQKKYNDWIIKTAEKYNVLVVLTGDVHYATPEGALTQRFIFNLRKEEDSEGDDTYKCHSLFYQNVEDFKQFNKQWEYGYTDEQIETWWKNSDKIAEKCNFTIPLGTGMKLPRYSFNEEEDFIEFSKAGLMKYFNCDTYEKCPQEYRERLELELEALLKKGAYRYLLNLSSIIKWAKDQGYMVGSGRGSCFLPDTNVQGKSIKDYKKGDRIKTGFLKEETKIDEVFSFDRDEEISVLKTEENKTIKCTKDHKILVVKKGFKPCIENAMFISASEIEPGDFLVKNIE